MVASGSLEHGPPQRGTPIPGPKPGGKVEAHQHAPLAHALQRLPFRRATRLLGETDAPQRIEFQSLEPSWNRFLQGLGSEGTLPSWQGLSFHDRKSRPPEACLPQSPAVRRHGEGLVHWRLYFSLQLWFPLDVDLFCGQCKGKLVHQEMCFIGGLVGDGTSVGRFVGTSPENSALDPNSWADPEGPGTEERAARYGQTRTGASVCRAPLFRGSGLKGIQGETAAVVQFPYLWTNPHKSFAKSTKDNGSLRSLQAPIGR